MHSKLELFHRVGNPVDAICQNNQAKVTLAGQQGNPHAISTFAKLGFTNLPQCLTPVLLDFFQIESFPHVR
jgi:hypothetical protein